MTQKISEIDKYKNETIMKANEIMVGDWVNSPFLQGTVLSVSKQVIEILTIKGEIIRLLTETAEPIPLTQEILEKNNIDYDFYDCFRFSFFNNKEGIEINVSGIFYVHELQHALRLCGLNELADNFKI